MEAPQSQSGKSPSSFSHGSSFGGQVDNLQTIKPFEERQLLNFYNNPFLVQKDRLVQHFLEKHKQNSNRPENELIERLEKSLDRFYDNKQRIEQLSTQINELETKCWTAKRVSIRKSGRCADGALVGAEVVYNKFTFDEDSFNDLGRYYYILKEAITDDHFHSQFQHKFSRLKFELKIYELCQVVQRIKQIPLTILDNDEGYQKEEEEEGKPKMTTLNVQVAKQSLLEWITALFVYFRKAATKHINDELREQCYQSLLILAKELLKIGTFEDRLFLLNHCLRCSAGSSTRLASQLVKCPSPKAHARTDYEMVGKEWVDFACTVIAVILSPVVDRDKFIEARDKKQTSSSKAVESWLLVDTDYDDEEELVSSPGSDLTEFDIINYLLQVPFEEMLDFVSLVQRFDDREEDEAAPISSVETEMIKLFAFNTHLIRVLKAGLQSFNCLRYKELTLYIASMVKLIIRNISSNWAWCRQAFTTKDQAMLVRLQVEYDHFMLRSISTLLATNRRGVWPLLAKVEFDGITEPMMWNIIWVIYSSNGRDEQANGGSVLEKATTVCAYRSTNFWKDTLSKYHQQWKFVFIEKLSVFSEKEEAVGLLNFFFKMGISRSSEAEEEEMSLLQEIFSRIAELSLVRLCLRTAGGGLEESCEERQLENQHFFIDRGRVCLLKLLTKFGKCLAALLEFLEASGEENLLEEPCLKLFASLDLTDFVPETRLLTIVNRWLVDLEACRLLNRLARLVLSKLSWGRTLLKTDQLHSLFLGDEVQRKQALKLFEAVEVQRKLELAVKVVAGSSGKTKKIEIDLPKIGLDNFGLECMINSLAIGKTYEEFVLWAWNCLLQLRIHPLATIPDISGWDVIRFGKDHYDTIGEKSNTNGYKQHRLFQRLPQLNYDTSLVTLKKGLEEGHPMAMFVATMMTDYVLKTGDAPKWLKVLSSLSRNNHWLPVLSMIKHFVPLLFAANDEWTTAKGKKKKNKTLPASKKLLAVLVELIGHDYGDLLQSVILYQLRHFTNPRSVVMLAAFWTQTLVGAADRCLAEKGGGGWRISVISSLNPFGGSGGTQEVIDSFFEKVTAIIDRICQHLVVVGEPQTLQLFVMFMMEKTWAATNERTSRRDDSRWEFSKLANLVDDPSVGIGGGSMFSSVFNFGLSSSTLRSASKLFQVAYLPDRSMLKSEWVSPFHILLRHNLNRLSKSGAPPPAFYLAYVLIEFDMKRCAKIWDSFIYEVHNAPELPEVVARDEMTDEQMLAQFESILKNVCLLLNHPPIPFAMLPINSLAVWLLKTPPYDAKDAMAGAPPPHPIMPLLWRNFFVLYFVNSARSSPSIGLKFLSSPVLAGLKAKLTILFDWHSRKWLAMSNEKFAGSCGGEQGGSYGGSISNILFEDRLVKLYRSYQLWLDDPRLHHHRVFVNLEDEEEEEEYRQPEFQATLLKYIFLSGAALHNRGNTVAVPALAIEASGKTDTFFFVSHVNGSALENDLEQAEMTWSRALRGPCSQRQYLQKVSGKGKEEEEEEDEIYLHEKLKETIEKNKKQQAGMQDGEAIMRDWAFWPTMDYINSLMTTLDMNILFADADNVLHLVVEPHATARAKKLDDPKVLLVLVHQIIVSVVEEAKLVESQWGKYTTENKTFCSELLPRLYQDVPQRVTKRVECDREFTSTNGGGCCGAAVLTFEYYESEMSAYVKKKADRNRLVQQSVVRHLGEEMPTQKIVGLVYMLQKVLNQLVTFYGGVEKSVGQLEQQVFGPMTNWFDSINTIATTRYNVVTMQVFDQLLEVLSELGKIGHTDPVNYFLLEMALNPKLAVNLIQQLAPCLTPWHVSPEAFVAMYELIGKNLRRVAPQTAFVLLSKFDMAGWLASSLITDDQRSALYVCLYQCLNGYGPCPSDESLVTFDLYRKHLQDVILFRFPANLGGVLNFLLAGCHQRTLAPSLWNNTLHTFGFYTRSLATFGTSEGVQVKVVNVRSANSVLDFDFTTFDRDLREYAQKQLRQQAFLNSHELFELLSTIGCFFKQMDIELGTTTELAEHYQLYTMRFLPVLAFFSYCWISTNAEARQPENADIVWRPLVDCWRWWLLPKSSTRFIAAEHLEFAWQLWLDTFVYLIDRFESVKSEYLSNLWQMFLTFIIEQPDRIEPRELAAVEEKLLKIKAWRDFTPSLVDIRVMYDSVIQTSYSIERLVAFVLAKIDWKRTLMAREVTAGRGGGDEEVLTFEQLLTVVENLSYVFISLVEHEFIVEIDLDSIPFGILEPNKVRMITLMILQLMKSKATDILAIFGSKDKVGVKNSSLFIMSLLKTIAQVRQPLVEEEIDANAEEGQEVEGMFIEPACNSRQEIINQEKVTGMYTSNRTWFVAKHLHYIEAVGSFVADYCNAHGNEVAKGSDNIRNMLLNTVETMRPTFNRLDMEAAERIRLFSALLRPVVDVVDEAIRYRLCVHYVTTFSYFTDADQLADLILAVNATVTGVSAKCAIYMLECFIENYLDLKGDLDFLVANLSGLPTFQNTSSNQKEMEVASGQLPEIYGAALVQSRSCLVLLVHIYGRLQKATVPEVCTRKYVCNLVGQCSHFRFATQQQTDNEVRVLLLWFELVALLTNQNQYVIEVERYAASAKRRGSNPPTIVNIAVNSMASLLAEANVTTSSRIVLDLTEESTYLSVRTLSDLVRSIHALVGESLSRGLFTFWKANKQSSNGCLFLLECLVLHGTCTLLETFFPETIDYNGYADQVSLLSFSSDSGSQNSLVLDSPSKASIPSRGGGGSSSPLLYSDSLKSKLRADLVTLYRASVARLKATMRKDKSFVDLWPRVDEMFGVFAEHALRLAKEPKDSLTILTASVTTATVGGPQAGDNDSLMSTSIDLEEKLVLDQQLRAIESRLQLQRKRFELIRRWLGALYADKSWLHCFV